MWQYESFIQRMPKVELHVHMQGAMQPATLLTLAQQYDDVALPGSTVADIQSWYTFSSFEHFVKVYLTICDVIRTVDDIEVMARDFLAGQAVQNIRYSEVTYTAYIHQHFRGISFADQLAALQRAQQWAKTTYGVTMGLIIDIPRVVSPEDGLMIADWAISGMGEGIVALGLGGPEAGYPAEKFQAAFDRAYAAGLPAVPHAGETAGAESIREALDVLHAVRIGHGVRCLEDETLVAVLRERQIPLELCPTSNVCLGVVPSFAAHPLPRLLDAGLFVTLNSDDPPMFGTTLTDEYIKTVQTFGWGREEVVAMVLRAAQATLLPDGERLALELQPLLASPTPLPPLP